MDTLWDALDTAEDSRETVIYTVAEGAHAGEKLLVSENCIHWQSENAEFLSGHIQKLLPHTESGLVRWMASKFLSIRWVVRKSW